jgi:hypothetical protein
MRGATLLPELLAIAPRPRTALAVAVGLVLASPAAGQLGKLTVTAGMPDSAAWKKSTKPPELQKCDDPALRVGWWREWGTVAFTIDSAGRIDTATVMAVKTSGTDAGLESYARRLLAGCTWKPARVDGQKTTVIVRLQFQPDQEKSPVAGPPLPVPTEPGLYLSTSRKLEEAPRVKSCPKIKDSDGGKMELSYIVGADGRVETGSVAIRSTDSESLGPAYTKVLQGCEYQPGRVGGEPVRTQFSVTYKISKLIAVDQFITVPRSAGPPQ